MFSDFLDATEKIERIGKDDKKRGGDKPDL